MAASSSLSDLAGWTREDYANRWTKILPSLIVSFRCSKFTDRRAILILFICPHFSNNLLFELGVIEYLEVGIGVVR